MSKGKTSNQPIIPTKTTDPVTLSAQAFIGDVEAGTLEDRSKEQGLIDLETALNYYFRKPISFTALSEIEKTSLELVIEANTVSGTSLGSEFNRIVSLAEEKLTSEDRVIELIDISDAPDSNGVEQLTAVVVIGTNQAPPYFESVGDWVGGAFGGKCVPTSTQIPQDASTKISSAYNYAYSNNYLLSAYNQQEEVYFTNIEVSGTGLGDASKGYPTIFPDLYVTKSTYSWDSQNNVAIPTVLGEFELFGSPGDNLHPGYPNGSAGIHDCVVQPEINTYKDRVAQSIYSVSPAPGSQKEAFKVYLHSTWLMVPGNAPCTHYIYAAYFGIPHV